MAALFMESVPYNEVAYEATTLNQFGLHCGVRVLRCPLHVHVITLTATLKVNDEDMTKSGIH